MPNRLLLLAALFLAGCIGTITIPGVNGGTGDDDDDMTPDDDDDTDDDATDDDDDATDDDDDIIDTQVDCGPVVVPDNPGEGWIFTGEAEFFEEGGDYLYTGCEAGRLFNNGQLVCEALWEVEGFLGFWEAEESWGAFRLDFYPVQGDGDCAIEQMQWRYRVFFNWEQARVVMEWSETGGQPNWQTLGEGDIFVAQEDYVQFDYTSVFFGQ